MQFWPLAIIATFAVCACSAPEATTSATPNSDIAATTQTSVTTAAEPERSYRWHTAEAGRSVQYGFPDTDDRLLRIDCIDGRITIGGPAGVSGPEGAQVSVTLGENDSAQPLLGVLAQAGDGMNFSVEVRPDDPALHTLLTGRALKVIRGEYSWEVPGDGAAEELRPLVQACRASAR